MALSGPMITPADLIQAYRALAVPGGMEQLQDRAFRPPFLEHEFTGYLPFTQDAELLEVVGAMGFSLPPELLDLVYDRLMQLAKPTQRWSRDDLGRHYVVRWELAGVGGVVSARHKSKPFPLWQLTFPTWVSRLAGGDLAHIWITPDRV